MADLTLSRLVGTLKSIFRINRLTIDASALTAARTLAAPNESGTIALLSDIEAATTYAVEYLLVAGGGGCSPVFGGGRAGGSGAGGFLSGITSVIRGTTYNFVVGAGGPVGTTGVPTVTSNGSNTTGFGLTAYGGGSGSGWDGTPGADGASGGGHWYDNTSPPADGIPGQGHAGSQSGGANNYTGGGAGGADGPGTVGVGGPGKASTITGTSVTYARGGHGNTYQGTIHDTNGAANTGNGADGVASGGSGVVILRMLTTNYSGASSGATVTTDGDYTVLKFTSSGSYIA